MEHKKWTIWRYTNVVKGNTRSLREQGTLQNYQTWGTKKESNYGDTQKASSCKGDHSASLEALHRGMTTNHLCSLLSVEEVLLLSSINPTQPSSEGRETWFMLFIQVSLLGTEYVKKGRGSGSGKTKRDYPAHVPNTFIDREATWTYLYGK